MNCTLTHIHYSKKCLWRMMMMMIIIKLHWQRQVSWLYFSIHPYVSALLAGLLMGILSPYRAAVGKYLLIYQHWHVRNRSQKNISFLSLSLLLQLFSSCLVRLIWLVSEIRAAFLVNVVSRICSRLRATVLRNSYQFFLYPFLYCPGCASILQSGHSFNFD